MIFDNKFKFNFYVFNNFADDKIDLTFNPEELADLLPVADNRNRKQISYKPTESKRGRSKSPRRNSRQTRSRSRSRSCPRTPLKDFDGQQYRSKTKDGKNTSINEDDDWNKVLVKIYASTRATYHNGIRSTESCKADLVSSTTPDFYKKDDFYAKLLKDVATALITEAPITEMLEKNWRVTLDEPVIKYEPLIKDKQSLERIQIPLSNRFKEQAHKPTFYGRVDGHGHFANLFVTYNCYVTEVMDTDVTPELPLPKAPQEPNPEPEKKKFVIEQFESHQPALKLAMEGFDELARRYPFMPINIVTDRLQKLLVIYRKQCAFPDDPEIQRTPDSTSQLSDNKPTYSQWQRQQPTNQHVWRSGNNQPHQGGHPQRGGQNQRRSGS